MLNRLKPFLTKPKLFQPGTAALWTDDHISKGMLEAHLHPARDAATRNHGFVDASVSWLASVLQPGQFPSLIDLGCGPGIYAERFYSKGYRVTGVDISRRSIAYAVQQAREKALPITYRQESYLDMGYENQFDVATLIFCDFGALPYEDRCTLLKNTRRALKPNGHLVLDVFKPQKYKGQAPSKTWEYCGADFFSPSPHLHLTSFYRYDEALAYLNQHIIVNEDAVRCFNIWEQTFTPDGLKRELSDAGFSAIQLWGDVAGAACTKEEETLCAIAGKDGR